MNHGLVLLATLKVGTGKSTLIKFIIAALECDPEEDVAYVTYTGKAAEVLRRKGCSNATTAHKLLYKAKPLPNGKFKFIPRDNLEKPFKIIVVDEISMLPRSLWELLLKHKVYILACGDPFQLPPISANDDNGVLAHPHIFLDEIMRQARESEIIQATLAIRNFEPLTHFWGKEVRILPKKDVEIGMYDWADQIIVGTNNLRNRINTEVRQMCGYGSEPEVGDKVICLRNCWEHLDASGESALVNGTIGYINSASTKEVYYPVWGLKTPVPILDMQITTEAEEYFANIWADKTAIESGQKFLTPQQEYKIFINKNAPPAPIEFNYGYAITCHRAQGSEWGKVLVFEENFPFGREEHARWLYTACTRASEKLILIKH